MKTCQTHPDSPLNSRNGCMACARERQRVHYQKHRESILKTNKVWREKNHDRILENQRRYVGINPTRMAQWKREWDEDHPVYGSYSSMRKRCLNKDHQFYKDYGGRGITICERWLGRWGYRNFESDMGPKPTPKHSVERRNNDLGYNPDNCYWATSKQQAKNRRSTLQVTLAGRTLSASEWAEELGIGVSSFCARLKNKWPEHLLLQPNLKPNYWKAVLANKTSGTNLKPLA